MSDKYIALNLQSTTKVYKTRNNFYIYLAH